MKVAIIGGKEEEAIEKYGDFMVSHLEKPECWKRWRNANEMLENGSCAVITQKEGTTMSCY